MSERELLVDGEVLLIDGAQLGLGKVSAALQWSLSRTISDRLPTVVVNSSGVDLSTIAFDLRIELLGEPIALELTRGMTIELLSYQPLTEGAEVLRLHVVDVLLAAILDHAYHPPQDSI